MKERHPNLNITTTKNEINLKENKYKIFQSLNLPLNLQKKKIHSASDNLPQTQNTNWRSFIPENQERKRNSFKHTLYNKTICFTRPQTNHTNSLWIKKKKYTKENMLKENSNQKEKEKETITKKKNASSSNSVNKNIIQMKLSIITCPKIEAKECIKGNGLLEQMNSSLMNGNEKKKRLPTMERIELELQNDLKEKKHLNRKETLKKKRTILLNKLYENIESSIKTTPVINTLSHHYYHINKSNDSNKASNLADTEVLTEETRTDTKPNENNRLTIKKKKVIALWKEDLYNQDWLLQDKLITNNYIYKQNKSAMVHTETQMKYLQNKINTTFSLLKQELDDTILYYQTKDDFY